MPVKHNNLACRAGFSAFPCVSFFSFLLWVSKALKGLNFLLSYSILWLASSRCLSPTPPPPSQGLLLQILCVKNLPGRPQLGYSNTWCHLDPPPFPLPLLPAHVQMNSLRLPASCLCVLYFFSFWLFIVSLILFVVLFISRCQSLLEVNLSFFHILPHHHSCLPPFPPHQIKSEGDLLRAPPPHPPPFLSEAVLWALLWQEGVMTVLLSLTLSAKVAD